MKITKFGHCCLLIEQGNTKILTDPGTYSSGQEAVEGISVVLITHEHADHLHIPALQQVLELNPKARVVCNTAVAHLLDEAHISYTLMADGAREVWNDVAFEAFEAAHADIYPTVPPVRNTGFFIADTLFYPGDAYIQPGKEVDILALPLAGPWVKLSEAIDYALQVKPRVAFPVHDGILKSPGLVHRVPSMVLPEHGIQFEVLNEGECKEF